LAELAPLHQCNFDQVYRTAGWVRRLLNGLSAIVIFASSVAAKSIL
jgi:hypothetical protein